MATALSPGLEELLKSDFQLFKVVGVLGSLVLVVGFQVLFPNRLALRRMLQNWRVNVPLAVLNTGLLSLLCGACVCTWAVAVRSLGIGFFNIGGFPYWVEAFATIAILDLVAWAWHRANHWWRWLWRLHRVHHSDANFEASTAFRFHPGELLISLGVRLLAVTLTGLPLLGLILFEVIYGGFNVLVHSDIRLNDRVEGALGLLVVTPSLHRLHHSVLAHEHNRNFGTIFSFWDRLAGTFLRASPECAVELGLSDTNRRELGLGALLKMPFQALREEPRQGIGHDSTREE